MLRGVLIILLAAQFVWPVMAEQPGARVALVVGVSAYQHVPRLPNTLNDARGVAAVLTRMGFDVDTVTDPDRTALESAVRRFGKRATGADAALFYYAGHALEFGGRNWLVPVQADLRNERDIRFEALEIDAVLEQIEGQARVSVLMLDSCRNNPFRQMLTSGSRGIDLGHGLAPQRAAVGTLVVYATAPGTEAGDGSGPNSPFTTALLRHIERPGIEIRSLLSEVRKDVREATGGRQIPWDSSALEGEFFLAGARTLAPPPVISPPDRDVEVAFWNSVKDTNDATELRAYLSRYPNGSFAALASNRLARLPEPSTRQPDAHQDAPPADLEAALRGALSMVSAEERTSQARRFVKASGGRALAVAPEAHASWIVWGEADENKAGIRALEGCQMFTRQACALVARGDHALEKPAAGSWPLQPQSRVDYRGEFDPAMLPVRNPRDLTVWPVSGYQWLKGPKALAIHPWGRIFMGTGSDQIAADNVALKACNEDPDRKGANGPCFLYSTGNQVVFPDRSTTASGPGSPATSPTAGIERIAAVAEQIDPALGKVVRNEYAALKGHKAFAVHLPTRRGFWWDRVDSATLAERWALEGCQMQQNSACILLATDDELRASNPLAALARPMERLTFSGTFQADKLPWNLETITSVRGYPGLPGEKAIAVRPRGARVAVVSGKKSASAAEREALMECNKGNPDVWPCFIYASGMRVVLPQRRTEMPR